MPRVEILMPKGYRKAKMLYEINSPFKKEQELIKIFCSDVAPIVFPNFREIKTEVVPWKNMFLMGNPSKENQRRYGLGRCDIVVIKEDNSLALIEAKLFKSSRDITDAIAQLLNYESSILNEHPGIKINCYILTDYPHAILENINLHKKLNYEYIIIKG